MVWVGASRVGTSVGAGAVSVSIGAVGEVFGVEQEARINTMANRSAKTFWFFISFVL
jgi:hypothetical protein